MAFSYSNIPSAEIESAVTDAFSHLEMKEKNGEYNFVCPYCGDINRPNKKKAYVYKDTWQFICYRCGHSEHIMQYFKRENPEIYSKLVFMGFDHSDEDRTKKKKEEKKPSVLPFMEGEIISVLDNHPLARKAVELCQHRMIRPEVYEKWFVCLEGEQFIKKDSGGAYILNENGKPVGNEYKNRLVIPFYKFGGSWGQFDARALDPENKLRYLNFAGVKREAYNIDFIDYDRPFFILEGTIDSTFIKNSIAIGGIQHFGEVLKDNPNIEKYKENCTIIWDNDDAGRSARIDSTKKGFNWFDWEGIKEKDINGAVMAGKMPLNQQGFVDPEFIMERSRPAKGAEILFALQYGDIKRKERAERKATRELLRAQMQSKNRGGVFF
jgi:hypothetical protein